MKNYKIYTSDDGYFICETFAQGKEELHAIEKELIDKGYIILEVQGTFIKGWKGFNNNIDNIC